jgi:hypothetical protein
MPLFQLLVDLRYRVLHAIRGAKNANGALCWDTTTPNSTTHARLQDLLEQTLSAAERVGIYRVTRHSCGAIEHNGYVIEQGPHGIREFDDGAFNWSSHLLYQGDRTSPCPCTPGAKPTKHSVIDELVVRRQGATAQHERLVNALWDIQQAIDRAGTKKTRSAIREHLLRAVMNLNDGILPQSVDDYIASRIEPRVHLRA